MTKANTTNDDRHAKIGKLRVDIGNVLESVGIYRNCLTCFKFIEAMEMCEEFNARPPARIIAYGCEKHSDEIPF